MNEQFRAMDNIYGKCKSIVDDGHTAWVGMGFKKAWGIYYDDVGEFYVSFFSGDYRRGDYVKDEDKYETLEDAMIAMVRCFSKRPELFRKTSKISNLLAKAKEKRPGYRRVNCNDDFVSFLEMKKKQAKWRADYGISEA